MADTDYRLGGTVLSSQTFRKNDLTCGRANYVLQNSQFHVADALHALQLVSGNNFSNYGDNWLQPAVPWC